MNFTNSKQKLTLQEFDDFEQKYNLNLPEVYREIILEYNGGYPEKSYFEEDREIYFDPIKYGEHTVESTLSSIPKDFLPKDYFPFGTIDGLSLCIDLSEKYYGSIRVLYTSGEKGHIADSLEELIAGLHEGYDEDDDEPLI